MSTCSSLTSPPPGIEDNDAKSLYAELVHAAIHIKCPVKLAEKCYEMGILTKTKHLLNDVTVAWFWEFLILSVVAADADGLQLWLSKWHTGDGVARQALDLAK